MLGKITPCESETRFVTSLIVFRKALAVISEKLYIFNLFFFSQKSQTLSFQDYKVFQADISGGRLAGRSTGRQAGSVSQGDLICLAQGMPIRFPSLQIPACSLHSSPQDPDPSRVCKCVVERMEGGRGVEWGEMGGRGDNCNSFCVSVFVCKRDWEINYMR